MKEYQLNSKGSPWIMANAGSGKTYVLSRRVVRLLLDGARPETIICLTYTKAAAAEMRERIIKLLKELAIAQGTALDTALEGMLGAPATDAQRTRAPHLLDMVLDSPLGGMQITTIHGFCQQLLGSFPLEAGISPHATLLDDRAQAELIHQAIHRLYSADDAQATASLAVVSEMTAEGRLNDWLSAILRGRRDWGVLEQFESLEAMRSAIAAQYPALESYDYRWWEQRLISGCDDATKQMMREAIPVLEAGNATNQELAAKLQLWLESPEIHQDTYLSVHLTDKLAPRARIFTQTLFGKGSLVIEQMAREQARVCEIAQAMHILCAIEETYHMAVLARGIMQLYAKAKQVRSALDYDDLIHHVESLLARELPWVMTKLDYRIDHVLLDEAQDTSPAQWHISEALVRELLSVEAPSGAPRSLFVVGDDKQSIYSFQGAAPEMFTQMRDAWRDALAIEPCVMEKTYRSAQPILQLADAVCTARHIGAEEVHHRLHRVGEAGKVELWPIIEQPKKEAAEPYHIPVAYESEVRAQAVLAANIATAIDGWLKEKRVLPARGRAIEADDILILVHRRKPMTPLLIQELQRLNISVAGIDRLALSSHLAVRDMIALMRWVYAPEDDLALAQVLRSPLIGMSEQELFEAAHGRGAATLWQKFQTHQDLQRWRAARHMTPYQFLHQLLELDGKRNAYAARFGQEVHEVLDELLHHAAMSEAQEAVSLFLYAEQLEQAGREIKRESAGADAENQVRVMTVHGAKGLEAPIVILADTTKAPDTGKELWFKHTASGLPTVAISDQAKAVPLIATLKQARTQALQREYERLLYVAITRAEDELYIAGVEPQAGHSVKDHTWYGICLDALKAQGISEENGIYRLSCPQEVAVAATASAQHTMDISVPDWAKTLAASEVKAGHFAPSRLVNTELALYETRDGDARSRGVIIHQLLELCSHAPHKERMLKLLRFIAPEWKAEQVSDAVEKVCALLQDPEFAWLWSGEGYNEISIAGAIEVEGEQRWMSGQIDRLVIAGNQIVILDYKTSQNLPKSVVETPMSYLMQMKAYQELLTKKYKDKTVRAALLWTAGPRLDWLDEQIKQVAWSDIRQAA